MTITITDGNGPSAEAVEEFSEKVFTDLLGTMNTYGAAIGVHLGWYEALAEVPSMTSVELASTTNTDERYAREWLEQQTVAGYIDVVDLAGEPNERRFAMSPAAIEVLSTRSSVSYMAPFPAMVTSLGTKLDRIVEVYRTGEGFGWHDHGDGARCGQAEANRPMFMNLLGQEYLASIPSVDATLRSGGRVADVGCGLGWSSIGIALAYPDAIIDGYDIDAPSIEKARAYAAEAGVADRVQFHIVDVGDLDEAGYDLVLALECVHDMPDPVSVLAAMKNMVSPGGTVIVMDERVGNEFTGEPDAVEQLFYGFSLICCLPDGRNAEESVATGTVMRQPTFERYVIDAGFGGVDVLPIENDFFRFYTLNQ